MRETGSSNTISAPLVVRADSELALARLLGLGPGRGARMRGTYPMSAGVVVGLLFGLALALVMISLGAVL